jgi:SIS domain-containing protein
VHTRFLLECPPALTAAAGALVSAYRAGHKYSTSLRNSSGGIFARGRRCRRSHLRLNSSAVTAIGNDYGFGQVFGRQLEALAVHGDVAVAISTSGNSASVVEVVVCARRLGPFTIGLTGAPGGRLRSLVGVLIAVPTDETPRPARPRALRGSGAEPRNPVSADPCHHYTPPSTDLILPAANIYFTESIRQCLTLMAGHDATQDSALDI